MIHGSFTYDILPINSSIEAGILHMAVYLPHRELFFIEEGITGFLIPSLFYNNFISKISIKAHAKRGENLLNHKKQPRVRHSGSNSIW